MDHFDFDQRAERLLNHRERGQVRCRICPPWIGENAGLRRPLKRTDRYKNKDRATIRRPA